MVAPLHLTAGSGPAACTYKAVRGPGGPRNSFAVSYRNPGPLGPLCVSLQFYSKNAVPRLGPPWTTWTTFGGRDLASLGYQGLRRFFFFLPTGAVGGLFFAPQALPREGCSALTPLRLVCFGWYDGLIGLTTLCEALLCSAGFPSGRDATCSSLLRCPGGATLTTSVGLPKVTPQARRLAFHCPWPNAWV